MLNCKCEFRSTSPRMTIYQWGYIQSMVRFSKMKSIFSEIGFPLCYRHFMCEIIAIYKIKPSNSSGNAHTIFSTIFLKSWGIFMHHHVVPKFICASVVAAKIVDYKKGPKNDHKKQRKNHQKCELCQNSKDWKHARLKNRFHIVQQWNSFSFECHAFRGKWYFHRFLLFFGDFCQFSFIFCGTALTQKNFTSTWWCIKMTELCKKII